MTMNLFVLQSSVVLSLTYLTYAKSLRASIGTYELVADIPPNTCDRSLQILSTGSYGYSKKVYLEWKKQNCRRNELNTTSCSFSSTGYTCRAGWDKCSNKYLYLIFTKIGETKTLPNGVTLKKGDFIAYVIRNSIDSLWYLSNDTKICVYRKLKLRLFPAFIFVCVLSTLIFTFIGIHATFFERKNDESKPLVS